MKRFVLACLLSAPGLALAQSGGGVVITTPLPPGVVFNPVLPSDPITVGTLPAPGDFAAIFNISVGAPFPVRFDFISAASQQNMTRQTPLLIDAAAIDGTPVVITIEEEGVRMPDEQFSLP